MSEINKIKNMECHLKWRGGELNPRPQGYESCALTI